MSGLGFIRGGGASPVDAFQRSRAAGQHAELNDIRIGEARRAERLAQDVDDAYGAAAAGQGRPQAAPAPAPQVPVPQGMDPHAAANLQSDPGAAQFNTGQPQGAAAAPASTGQRLRDVRGNVADRLMQVKGARGEAARMMMADAQQEEQVMRQTFELAKTDPVQAKQYAQQFGVKLPPQMEAALNDKNTVLNWTRAMDAAAKSFPDPHQSGKRFQFAQQYFLGLNSGRVAETVAGAQGPQDTPRYAPQLTQGVDKSGQNHQMIFDPNTGQMKGTGYLSPHQPAPQYLYSPEGVVMTNRNGVAVPVKTETGEPFKGTGLRGVGANGRTTSIAPNPQTIRMRALAWTERQKDAAGVPLYQTPQQREAAIQAYEAYITGDYAKAGQILGSANPQAAKSPGMLERLFGSLGQDNQQPAGQTGSGGEAQLGGALQNGGIPPTYTEGGVSGTFTGEFEGGLPVYATSDGRRFVAE
ncbi:hypothetical protein [Ferrovibrio terrae]|uniref:hypothetical protein n=1 Tax=Ferrovibrio terrae TaxID=2594003 RepID=UPI003137ACEE